LQDEDVLDTWFSSWLWPFSTLGWQGESGGGSAPLASNPPKGGFSATPPALRAEDLRRFYPTTALVTAYDIIFFWVSRMIMAGMEFTGVPPFKDIYIHGLLRDKQGRKMSKTLGNGIDPLEIVDEYGADALKFTLAFLCAQGQDILLDKESFKIGSKFVNKIWNASRYILMNMEGGDFIKDPQLCAADKWIYARLAASAASVTESLLAYRYNEAANLVYEFFWNDFCDWYVECSKLSINDSGSDRAEKNRALSILLDVLSQTLCLLHPFVPFVTEEIYSKLPKEITNGGMLILQNYPCAKIPSDAAQTEEDFSFLQEIVKAVRTLRSECIIANDKKLRVTLNAGKKYTAFIRGNKPLICLLAGLSALDISDEPEQNNKTPPHGSIGIAGTGFDAFVFIADAVDISSLKTKWENGAEKDKKYLNALKAKLSNDNFIKNAPPELIELEKQKLLQTETRINKINMYLQTLE
jgi:valyl-tRNA synthetase